MIQRSAARMRELIDVVLSYTRRSLGALLPISVKPINLGEVAAECVHDLSLMNEGREIALSLNGDLAGTWDAVRMAQVTSNLVGNALKYSAPETAVKVTLDGSDADEVILEVQNLGEPIPDHMVSDIFEPLFRVPGAVGNVHGGGANMGLGLYIAREIVSGARWVHSCDLKRDKWHSVCSAPPALDSHRAGSSVRTIGRLAVDPVQAGFLPPAKP